MIWLIAAWVALLTACGALIWWRRSGTLLLAYLLDLALIQVPQLKPALKNKWR